MLAQFRGSGAYLWLQPAEGYGKSDSLGFAQNLMVVVNKMDLWLDSTQDALTYYEEGVMRDAIDSVCSSWCRENVVPSFHVVSAMYDSLNGKAPNGQMSARHSLRTLELLRAQIRCLLAEVGA